MLCAFSPGTGWLLCFIVTVPGNRRAVVALMLINMLEEKKNTTYWPFKSGSHSIQGALSTEHLPFDSGKINKVSSFLLPPSDICVML